MQLLQAPSNSLLSTSRKHSNEGFACNGKRPSVVPVANERFIQYSRHQNLKLRSFLTNAAHVEAGTTPMSADMAKEDVLKALSQIIDPDFGTDIVSCGFVKDLHVDESFKEVSFRLELTTLACPIKDMFEQKANEAVAALPWVDRVNLKMSAQPAKPVFAGELPKWLQTISNIIAVSSCKLSASGDCGMPEVVADPLGEVAKTFQTLGVCVVQQCAKIRQQVTTAVSYDKSIRAIRVRVPDSDEEFLLHPATVRWNDCSAQSVDEWTGEQKLQFGDVAEDVEPEDIQPMGNYAVLITWPDGFSQSYPFDSYTSTINGNEGTGCQTVSKDGQPLVLPLPCEGDSQR